MGPQDGIQDWVLGHQAVLKDGMRRRRASVLIVALDVAQGDGRMVVVAYEPQQVDGFILGHGPQKIQSVGVIGLWPTLVTVCAVTEVALAAVATGWAASITLARSASPTEGAGAVGE